MSQNKEPLSPILICFKQDLQFNGLEEHSQESYCRAVRKFSEFLKREPDTASEDDLRNYLLFLRLLRVRGEFKLPVVISIDEVHTFLKLIDKPSMLCFFTVVYKLGFRLQEALNLQVADFDSTSWYKPMRVSAEEFIRRFLQHVLPSGFQKVRHFGFAHPQAKTNWEWLSMLVTVTLNIVNMVYVLTVAAKPLAEKRTLKCSECGSEMTCIGFVPSAPRRFLEFDTS